MNENKNILESIYDSESFGIKGHELITLLEQYLTSNLKERDKKTLLYSSPNEMLNYWQNYVFKDSTTLYADFIERSVQVHNTKYIGHQVVPPAPDAILASLVGAIINNGGAVYEMGMASNALEKVVIDMLKPYFGFNDKSGGIMTSGGTLANLTALLCARSEKGKGVWLEGTKERYAFMVSEEAHYCIDRAVRIMGWGDDGIIKVPVDDQFRMRTDLLNSYKAKAEKKGIKVIGIVGSAPTTSTGNYDNLFLVGRFAQENDLWFHIDGAHGGPAVFSEKYKHLMVGCNLADSITVDGHKMMMLPALTTILFFKNERLSYNTFSQEAQYLWSNDQQEWHNGGKRTFECTKFVMSLRYYTILQQHGIKAFSAFIEECYDKGKLFANLITNHKAFELAIFPDSNIVCFKPKRTTTLKQLNEIRKKLLEDGKYYIVQTSLKGTSYLRVSIMNPFISELDFIELLDYIDELSKAYLLDEYASD